MRDRKQKTLNILVGSGLSYPLPSVDKLTKEVCGGVGWLYSSDCFSCRPSSATDDSETVQRVLTLINAVRRVVNEYFLDHPTRKANYEDVYSVLKLIEEGGIGAYPDPTVGPLVNRILPEICEVLVPLNELKWSLKNLAHLATEFIHDVISERLSKVPDCCYLSSFTDFLCDQDFERVNIVSLNHDRILEESFQAKGITYNSGFRKSDDGFMVWNRGLLSQSTERIRLIKLHGSIDWFSENASPSRNGRIISGNYSNLNVERPLLLIGTTTKTFEYFRRTYYDMMRAFVDLLGESSSLLICGYGFKDRVVNYQIVSWLGSCNAKVSIIDKKQKNEFRDGLVGNIYSIYEKIVDFQGGGVEAADWKVVKQKLFSETMS